MPQLDIATYSSQIFWLIICLIILFTALRYFFIPRLEKSIEVRQKRIEKMLLEANKMTLEAESLNHKYADEVKKAYLQAQAMHQQAISEFEEQCSAKLKEVAKEQTEKLAAIGKDLDKYKSDFMDKLEDQSNKLMEEFVEKLMADENSSKAKREK